MKTIFPYFLICVLIISCKKEQANNLTPPTSEMVVMEENTTTPISGVRVDCYTCLGEPEPWWGCLAGKKLISTGYTNNEGKYIFSEEEYRNATEGITLTKEHYFSAIGGIGKRYMIPIATIKMHLIKQGNYPPTALFEYYVIPTRDSSHREHRTLDLYADTTITVFGAVGNEIYTIKWNIADRWNCSDTCSGPYFNSGSVSGLRFESFGDTLITIPY